MTPYNPDIHHRRSIRLKGYDYASAGLYFVTICTQNRECLFGEIQNGEMVLNDAGRMVERWYHKTQENFPDIVCHEMIVMPNHFHCIWENVGIDNASGSPLSAVVGWFKTMSTNEYIRGVKQLDWPPFDRKLWQRNYYEHIICNDQSFYVSNYITNNPARWTEDTFYPNN